MQSCVRLSRFGNRKNVFRVIPSILLDTAPTQRPNIPALRIKTESYVNSSIKSAPDSEVNRGYAVVDHSEAYEAALQGRHGQQLALARLEGIGKDDAPFDPFIEEEKLAANTEEEEEEEDFDGDEDDDDDDVENKYLDLVEEEEGYESDEEDSLYNTDGSVRRKKSALATLRAGFPAGGQFAVIQLAGFQHKVTTDDLIVVNRLQPVDVYKIGSVHTLKDILLVGSSHMTLVGMPTVPGAEVDVMVEEITRDEKVIIFKKRRRKHSQRKNGFRRDVTMLRILDIRMPDEYKDHKHVSRDILEELEEKDDESSVAAETTADEVRQVGA